MSLEALSALGDPHCVGEGGGVVAVVVVVVVLLQVGFPSKGPGTFRNSCRKKSFPDHTQRDTQWQYHLGVGLSELTTESPGGNPTVIYNPIPGPGGGVLVLLLGKNLLYSTFHHATPWWVGPSQPPNIIIIKTNLPVSHLSLCPSPCDEEECCYYRK